MNNYTLLSIKCSLPDKLSAANILPDPPPQKKGGHAHIMVEFEPEYILTVRHESKFKGTGISHKV